MKDSRFAWICIALGILACGLIAAYYFFFAPPPLSSAHLAQFDSLGANITQPGMAPHKTDPPSNQPEIDKSTARPDASASKVEFKSKLLTPNGDATPTSATRIFNRDDLPQPRLAPDMFAFSALPFDAPNAAFPLVQVGQRNLEWERTTRDMRDKTGGETEDSRYSSLSGRPPANPPQPPVIISVPGGGGSSGAGTGGNGSQNKPDKPPPEVSTSGL